MRSHTFSGQPLDRMDGHRAVGRIDLDSPDVRLLAVSEGSVLIIEDATPRARFYEPGELELARERDLTLLGRRDGITYLSVKLEPGEIELLQAGQPSKIVTIRSAGQMLDRSEASIIAYAHALSAWQIRSRYCGTCGAPAALEDSGHRRRCTDDACGAIRFPRTDPTVIGIVSCGDECLLVNQPQWSPDRYATIAGFVEPGESLEEAMAREVLEEVGLETADVRYHSSQPWPFPMSLMIGFEVEAASRTTPRLSDEIRSARWFTRGQLRDQLASGEIGISTPLSISFALIGEWYGNREELAGLATRRPW